MIKNKTCLLFSLSPKRPAGFSHSVYIPAASQWKFWNTVIYVNVALTEISFTLAMYCLDFMCHSSEESHIFYLYFTGTLNIYTRSKNGLNQESWGAPHVFSGVIFLVEVALLHYFSVLSFYFTPAYLLLLYHAVVYIQEFKDCNTNSFW